LITWLLNQSKPSQASADLVKVAARNRAVQNRKKDEASDEAAPHTATVESAKSRIQPHVMERLDLTAASQLPRRELAYQVGEIVTELLQEEQIRLNGPEHQAVVDLLLDDMLGLGPLEPLLADESITDILVNGYNNVFVERAGRLDHTPVTFKDDRHLLRIIDKIVAAVGRRVDESSPMVDARLADGSRVNAIIQPLAVDGPLLSIRKFARIPINMEKLVEFGTMPPAFAELLRGIVRCRRNVLISGGTGTGKTTMLNAMSAFIDGRERIVTIEDAAELRIPGHVVRLEAHPPNAEGAGEITIRSLLRSALRLRPDRIIVGEVRGPEALDLISALNTGHRGSMSTIHANSPEEAMWRLETLALSAGTASPSAVSRQLYAAIGMVVQLERVGTLRRIAEIAPVADD